MKPIRMSLACLLLLGAVQFDGLLYAQEADSAPEDASATEAEAESEQRPSRKDPGNLVTEWGRDVGTVVNDVSLAEADIADYISHREGFESSIRDETAWARLSVNLKEGYDLVLKSEAYLNWAEKTGLDPVDWLKKAVRIKVLSYRIRADAELPKLKTHLKKRKALVEAEKYTLSTSDFENASEALETAGKVLDQLSGALKTLPSASDAEKAAIASKTEELR